MQDSFIDFMKFQSMVSLFHEQRYLELFILAISIVLFLNIKKIDVNYESYHKLLFCYKYKTLMPCYEVELEGERVCTRGVYHKDVDNFFSTSFQGIWHRMIQVRPCVQKLKECVDFHKNSSLSDLNETFMVNQQNCFLLENNIYAELHCTNNTTKEEHDSG